MEPLCPETISTRPQKPEDTNKTVTELLESSSNVVIFTDGSYKTSTTREIGCAGAGIVFSNNKTTTKYEIPCCGVSNSDAEIAALLQAVKTFQNYLSYHPTNDLKCFIFTDSCSTLQSLTSLNSNNYELYRLYKNVKKTKNIHIE